MVDIHCATLHACLKHLRIVPMIAVYSDEVLTQKDKHAHMEREKKKKEKSMKIWKFNFPLKSYGLKGAFC